MEFKVRISNGFRTLFEARNLAIHQDFQTESFSSLDWALPMNKHTHRGHPSSGHFKRASAGTSSLEEKVSSRLLVNSFHSSRERSFSTDSRVENVFSDCYFEQTETLSITYWLMANTKTLCVKEHFLKRFCFTFCSLRLPSIVWRKIRCLPNGGRF